MSFDEIIYRIDNYPSIELKKFRSKDEITEMEINEEMKLCDLLKMDDKCKIKKTVHFPEDNSPVSDYFECKSYWQEHKLCSNDELIKLYNKSCQYYHIKPIPAVLKQIRDFNFIAYKDRIEIFEISNIKLDMKHIESLEEIFKHVQFKVINCEKALQDDDSATSLFEIIEYYQSCLRLNISYNGKMSYIGFNAFSKMLKRTPCIETVDLRGILFTDSLISPLNRALKFGNNLKILHLENSNICSKNLQNLSAALKFNGNLQELYLSNNKMVFNDGIFIGSILKVNRFLKTLDLRNNCLGDIGLSHICDGLFHECLSENNVSFIDNDGDGLSCLILCNNSITYNGMSLLSSGLKVCRSLKTLNLGYNPISNDGVHILKEGLMSNKSIFNLGLRNCKITCQGGASLAEYLAETNVLMRLDIRNNDIRTAGLIALSASMKLNTSVIRLDIDSNPKKTNNIQDFFDTQCDALKMIHQRVQENRRSSVEVHDFELSQYSINCGNQSRDTNHIITGVDTHITETNDLSTIDHLSCTGSEEVSESPPNHNSPNSPIPDISRIKSLPPLVISSDFDSPPDFFSETFTKVLSPTDRMLIRENRGYDDEEIFDIYKSDLYSCNGDVKCENSFDYIKTDIAPKDEMIAGIASKHS